MKNSNEIVQKVLDNIDRVIVGKRRVTERLIVALLSKGHVLIEDVPGVGKTTIIKAFSKSLDLNFKRIQFTPDLMPSDITGLSIFNPKLNDFEFKQGPIMTEVLLADEINRTSPKTQAALLEAMQENQVTVDGNRIVLNSPFIVMATENPIDYEGTFPLPEAQIDRFMMKISIDYPTHEGELEILERFGSGNPLDDVKPVVSRDEVLYLQSKVDEVEVDKSLMDYIVRIVTLTRKDPSTIIGSSPRGTLALFKASKALALIKGRTFVIPDDIKSLAKDVLCHRILLRPEQRIAGKTSEQILSEILNRVEPPKGSK